MKTASYIFGKVAFVHHPTERRIWFRTHYCTAVVDCPYCHSPAGVPCRGKHGYNVATHVLRRRRAER